MVKNKSVKSVNRLNGEMAEIKKTATTVIITKGQTNGEKLTKKNSTTELRPIDQKVLKFCKGLAHPASTNEVRDKFDFPLRANARRIFKKLESLGYGEDKKIGKRYLFHIKGQKYEHDTPEAELAAQAPSEPEQPEQLTEES